MDSCFFNVFCHSCHICASVFKVCVEVGLVLYGEGHSLNAWLLIREGKLIQDVNILKSIRQRDLLTHCVIPLQKDQTHINSVSAPGTFTYVSISLALYIEVLQYTKHMSYVHFIITCSLFRKTQNIGSLIMCRTYSCHNMVFFLTKNLEYTMYSQSNLL